MIYIFHKVILYNPCTMIQGTNVAWGLEVNVAPMMTAARLPMKSCHQSTILPSAILLPRPMFKAFAQSLGL